MAQSILIFDFGTNEEAAQQARHKVAAWQQGSRLGKKMLLKFDREESSNESAAASAAESAPKGKPAKKKAGKEREAGADGSSPVRVLVRLEFSDHEKLTQQRWLDRFAAEEPFKSAKAETVRQGSPSFAETAERFESLD